MSGPSENLYHGYKTFTVKEQGISRVRVDMVHSHLRIRFRVTWKYSTAPERGEYYALLESIPSQYALMPQYIYPAGSLECVEHDCDGHDLYPSNCNNVIHHIPLTCRKDESDAPVNVLTYRHDTKINADWEMWGEFTAYRIKTETQPVLHLLDMSGNSILPGGRSLDLQGYFDWYEYELDHTLKQDYIIDIVVEGTSVKMSTLTVGDWDEGGPL